MNNRKGFAAVMMTVSLVTLCAVGGLVTDLGWAYHEKQKAQGAAEAAVLSASSYAKSTGLLCGLLGLLCQSTDTNCTGITGSSSLSTACQYAALNGFTDGSNNVTVKMSSGTGTPPGMSGITADYWVQSTITENVFPMFSAVLGGHNQLQIKTIATSATVAGAGGGTIYVLGSGSGTVTTDGTAALGSASDIWVNSTASDAVQVKQNDNLSCSGGAKVHVCGSCQKSGSSTISPAPDTGCSNHSDPYVNMSAPSSSGCDYSGDQNFWWGDDDDNVLQPGIYCGDINIGGTASVTMKPGLYVIKGDVNVNTLGRCTGNGVTLHLTSGKCNMTNGTVTLSPQTSGTYKGVTIYQDRANTNQCKLTCGSTQNISGLVYAPAATVTHCGGSAASAPNQTIVCNKLVLSGGTNLNSPATTLYTPTPGGLCR